MNSAMNRGSPFRLSEDALSGSFGFFGTPQPSGFVSCFPCALPVTRTMFRKSEPRSYVRFGQEVRRSESNVMTGSACGSRIVSRPRPS